MFGIAGMRCSKPMQKGRPNGIFDRLHDALLFLERGKDFLLGFCPANWINFIIGSSGVQQCQDSSF
jgi:hypothetical protein